MADQPSVRIRVTRGYSGARIGGAYIPEGDYDVNDPLLQEQSQFLLETGRAVTLDANGKAATMTVQQGAADRDLSGKPIVVPVGQNQGQLTNTAPPVFAQFPNNVSASEVIQPYEINATEPAIVQESVEKIMGNPSVKSEVVARQESAVTDAAIAEAEAVRAAAAQTDGGGDPGPEASEPTPEDDNDPFAGRNVEDLIAEVKDKGLTVRDDDGNTVALSKAKRDQLITAIKNAG